MPRFLKYVLLCFIFLNFYQNSLLAQNKKTDSLLALVDADKEDTNKVIHLNSLARNFKTLGLSDKSLNFAKKAAFLSEKIGFLSGQADALLSIALLYDQQGNYPKALDCFFKALLIAQKTNNKNLIAKINGGLGVMYFEEGDYSKALGYNFEALKLFESVGNQHRVAITLGNIAGDYYKLDKKDTALTYYLKALEMDRKLNDKLGVAIDMGNIGSLYKDMGKNAEALDFDFKALRLDRELNDIRTMAAVMGNIGNVYAKLKNYKEAEKYMKDALVIADSIGYIDVRKDVNQSLADLYFSMGHWQQAFLYFKKYTLIKDSLVSKEKSEQIGKIEAKSEYDKQLALRKAREAEMMELTNIERKKQRVFTMFIMAIAIAIALIAAIVFRTLKITRRQKTIITEQKMFMEEKHKEITDSINYAERIQRALLASKEILDENLTSTGSIKRDYFILFKPKDIVSGDFYWATKLSNQYFALFVGDSTGHGVPGAIMSILNIACLDKAATKGIVSPDLLLNETRRLVIENLKNDGSAEGGKDGMDGSLLSFDFKNNIIYCACANNPIWLIRGSELIEIKADRMPIGKHEKDTIPFTLNTFPFFKDDLIYVLTDGFADQFGDASGKKFKQKQLQELLLSVRNDSMETQKQKLKNAFIHWKGKAEQIDDVCIVGIRL